MDEFASVNMEPVAETPLEAVDTNVSEGVDNVEVTEPQEQAVETAENIPEKPAQDADTNSKFAQMRREQEQLRKQLDTYNEWVASKFGDYEVKDMDSYMARMEQQLQEQRNTELMEKGIDPDEFNQLIENNPKVKEANEILSQMQAEKAQQTSAENFFKAHADVNPDSMPPEVIEAWATGQDMEAAYKDWDYNRLRSMDMETVKQNAITEYIEKVKKGNYPIEAGGSTPVMKSEPADTWEAARDQTFAMLRGN